LRAEWNLASGTDQQYNKYLSLANARSGAAAQARFASRATIASHAPHTTCRRTSFGGRDAHLHGTKEDVAPNADFD
jgi:hypothetical protein